MVRKYGPSLGLLVLIAAITMWVMMKNTDMSAVLQAARSLRWYCLLAALAITLLAVALEGVIIRLLLNTRGSRTGLGVAISWAFVGFLSLL